MEPSFDEQRSIVGLIHAVYSGRRAVVQGLIKDKGIVNRSSKIPCPRGESRNGDPVPIRAVPCPGSLHVSQCVPFRLCTQLPISG